MKSVVRVVALIAVTLLAFTACTSTDAEPGGEPSSSSGTTHEVEITLSGDSVTPNGEKLDVAVGDVLALTITSDHDDEIHIHGIDIEIPVTAGETVTEEVTLEQTGSFEVESHHPAKVILILNVR